MQQPLSLLLSSLVFFGLSALPAGAQERISCAHKAQSVTGPTGTSAVVVCPAGRGAQEVWGTNSYSDDSSICTAAVHAGFLPADQAGLVTIMIAPGQRAYPASTANGISTQRWGNWGRSFIVIGEREGR